jgi:hypothetical protein
VWCSGRTPGSSWQNGYVERLIGSIPPECVSTMSWRSANMLTNYCTYYNGAGTDLALNKDTPLRIPLHRPVQATMSGRHNCQLVWYFR